MDYTRKNHRQAVREIRHKEAEKRNETFQSLSPEAQIAVLDERLGKGIGAVKQRAKLAARCTQN